MVGFFGGDEILPGLVRYYKDSHWPTRMFWNFAKVLIIAQMPEENMVFSLKIVYLKSVAWMNEISIAFTLIWWMPKPCFTVRK